MHILRQYGQQEIVNVTPESMSNHSLCQLILTEMWGAKAPQPPHYLHPTPLELLTVLRIEVA